MAGQDVEIRLCPECAVMAMGADFAKVRIVPDPDWLHRACIHVKGRA